MEISEILFNELAFFKLMQDLDSSGIAAAKHKNKKSAEQPSKMKNTMKVRWFHFSSFLSDFWSHKLIPPISVIRKIQHVVVIN